MTSYQSIQYTTEGCDGRLHKTRHHPYNTPPNRSLAQLRRIVELKISHRREFRSIGALRKSAFIISNQRKFGWSTKVISKEKVGDVFDTQLAILKRLHCITALQDCVPQFMSNNPLTQTYTIRDTVFPLQRFDDAKKNKWLRWAQLVDFKNQLRQFGRLLYNHGIQYKLDYQHLQFYYAVFPDHPRLFLGFAEAFEFPRTEQVEWGQQSERVEAQIGRFFAPLEMRILQETATSIRRYIKVKNPRNNKSKINRMNHFINIANQRFSQANAVKRNINLAIREALATINVAKQATTRGTYASVLNPQSDRNETNFGEELMEKALTSMCGLEDLVNALYTAYGGPVLNDIPEVWRLPYHDNFNSKVRGGGAVAMSYDHGSCQEVISTLNEEDSVCTEVAVLEILRDKLELKGLRDHVPQLVSSNASDQSYAVQYTRCELLPFRKAAHNLSYDDIQHIKDQLFMFIRLMFEAGVRCSIYPHNIYLYTPISGERSNQLFLGSVADSDLLYAGQSDWTMLKYKIWQEIEGIFQPVEMRVLQAQDIQYIKLAQSEMSGSDAAVGASNASPAEPGAAVIMGAYKIIKTAHPLMKEVLSLIKQINALSMTAEHDLRHAYYKKENIKLRLRQMNNLDCKVQSLVLKYGLLEVGKLIQHA